MSKKTDSGMMLAVLVVSVLTLIPGSKPVEAQEVARVKIINPLTGDNKFNFSVTDHPVNSTFTADFYVVNVTKMCGWQIYIRWNNTVINFQRVWIPDDNAFAPAVYNGATLISPQPYVENETNDIYDLIFGAAILPLTAAVDVPDEALLYSINFTIAAAPQNSSKISTNIELMGKAEEPGSSLGSYVLETTVGGRKIVTIFAEPAIVSESGITGDVDGDGNVDRGDIVLLCDAFGSSAGEPNWNANYDLDLDGRITMGDIVIGLDHFGQHYP